MTWSTKHLMGLMNAETSPRQWATGPNSLTKLMVPFFGVSEKRGTSKSSFLINHPLEVLIIWKLVEKTGIESDKFHEQYGLLMKNHPFCSIPIQKKK